MLRNDVPATGILVLRLGLGLFMLLEAVQKFAAPDMAGSVLDKFYHLPVSPAAVFGLGAMHVLLAVAVLVGFMGRVSYLLAFVLQLVAVIALGRQLAAPYVGVNILFWAQEPLLFAYAALYLLRDADLYSIDGLRRR